LTWREAFASLQLEVEEKIGRPMRESIARINAAQDEADVRLRAAAEAANG